MNDAADDATRWPGLNRVRRAIVVVDLVESVRLMQQAEDDVIDRWRRFVREVRTEVLPAYDGQMVKSLGDGMLLAFESTRSAVAAAISLQASPVLRAAESSESIPFALRVGAHWADVVADDVDVYGAGVNLAARLAASADPGAIVISAEMADTLHPGVDADLEDLGDIYLKHFSEPVRAYLVHDVSMRADAKPPPRFPVDDLRPGLAVVPFSCRDESDPGSVLGDLLVDEITRVISACPEWRVISKLSSSAFTGRNLSLEGVGSSLRADYVCTGAYHVKGLRVIAHVELAHVHSGQVLWAERLEGSVADVLAGQDDLFLRASDGLAVAIFGHGLRAVSAMPLPMLRSHELLLGAVALMHRARRSEFDRSLELIDYLQQRHPRSSQPHSWRAKWHVLRVVQGWSQDPSHDGDLAMQAGKRAIDADTSSSLALAMQGLVHAYLKQDFDAAKVCYDEALEENPNESLALLLRGTMHAFLAEGEAAYLQTQQALRLSPLDPLRYFYLSLAASAAISAGRYDEAITLAQTSLRSNRVHLSTYRALAMAQSLSGRVEDATKTVEQLLHLDPGFTVRRFKERFPGRDRSPTFTQQLADALSRAGLPA